MERRVNLLADRDGLWAVLPPQGMLYRVEGGRITQRIAVGDHGPRRRARRRCDLGGRYRRGRAGRWEVARVDPDDGKVVESVELGPQVPQTLVPVGKDLWVITSGGEAKLVSPG